MQKVSERFRKLSIWRQIFHDFLIRHFFQKSVLGLKWFEQSGDLDEDMFMDVALGRVVARDLSSGSLLVSRIANYEYVRDPESEGKYAMGRSEVFFIFFPSFPCC